MARLKQRRKTGSAKGQPKPLKRELDRGFPDRLSRAMDLKNLNAPALAELTASTRQTIGNYLNGKTKLIEVFMLFVLADALEVSPTWLLLGKEPRAPQKALTPEQDRVLQIFNRLPTQRLKEHWLKQAADLIDLHEVAH